MSSDCKHSPGYRLFEYACSRLAADNPVEASKEFESLHEQYPDELRVIFMLAGSYYETQRFDEAAQHFRRIVSMRPTHELSSRLLFHSLWNDGRHKEAIEEMNRFPSLGASEHYSGIKLEIEAKRFKSGPSSE